MAPQERVELPVVGQPRPTHERADALRNRQRILEAAGRLFAERGVAGVTMDDVAAAAGVGKGTLYRRFEDKSGLAGALLGERGAELQGRVLGGPPPLGPGADPQSRLEAFVAAFARFQAEHLDLVLLSETWIAGGRLHKPAYHFWRQHVTMLLRAGGAPGAVVRADLLLAGLAAEQLRFWLRDEHRPLDEVEAELRAVARGLLAR